MLPRDLPDVWVAALLCHLSNQIENVDGGQVGCYQAGTYNIELELYLQR
jgi:hypothetical protein